VGVGEAVHHFSVVYMLVVFAWKGVGGEGLGVRVFIGATLFFFHFLATKIITNSFFLEIVISVARK